MKGIDISRINRFARNLFGANLSVWKKLFDMCGGDSTNFLMRESCRRLESCDYSISYRLKPKRCEQMRVFRQDKGYENLAIVLQGPIYCKDHYTVETVKYYRMLYPDAIIVVSTWDTENQEELDRIRAANTVIQLSQMPSKAGHKNINCQIVSSKTGIEKAAELGAAYICKCRTDQRIYRPEVFDFLISLMDTYPPIESDSQNKRLVTLSMNYGNMFYPYFISDFFYFGTSQEMLRLFSIDTDERAPFDMPPHSTRRDCAKEEIAPEVSLIKRYLVNLGYLCEDTVEAYWDAVRKYLICVDIRTIDLDWPKYESHYTEHIMIGSFFEDDDELKIKTANLDFINWFNLYSGTLKYTSEYEKYADVLLN